MTTHGAEPNTVPSSEESITGDGVAESSPMLRDPNLPVSGIEDPADSDVLCGRGGAALRHPGNQTYRRLVHLNKGLYITCLKAEKLKISRSIVCAIREQNGRFLEKDTKNGTWYDIGDKKAMEKTSQALREGQPKLRQQIVELGGGAAGAAALLETQFPTARGGGFPPSSASFHQGGNSTTSFESQQAAAAAAVAAATAATQQNAYAAQHMMAPPPAASMPPDEGSFHGMRGMGRGHSMPPRQPVWDNNAPEFMQQLSLDDEEHQLLMRSSFNTSRGEMSMGGDLGDSQQTLLHANTFMESVTNLDLASRMNIEEGDAAPTPFPPVDSDSESASETSVNVDRRGVFAKMKYDRAASGKLNGSDRIQTSGRSLGEALSYSEVGSTSYMSNISSEAQKVPSVAEVFGGGSRRSVMSGLSKISDADNSIISDLSRKIGNVSTRSILSEISCMDEESVDAAIDTPDSTAPVASVDGTDSGERSPEHDIT